MQPPKHLPNEITINIDNVTPLILSFFLIFVAPSSLDDLGNLNNKKELLFFQKNEVFH